MSALPHDIKNIVWWFAFAQPFKKGWQEVIRLIEFRECVPPVMCNCDAMDLHTQLFILNPYCRGTPYVPLDSIHFNPWGFNRRWLSRHVSDPVVRGVLRTYRAVLMRHADLKDISKWNHVLRRDLAPLRPGQCNPTCSAYAHARFDAIVAALDEAKPLSKASLLFPWPGSRAWLLARSSPS